MPSTVQAMNEYLEEQSKQGLHVSWVRSFRYKLNVSLKVYASKTFQINP
jgi:hypothetical protein